MKNTSRFLILIFCSITALIGTAQPYFQSTATIDGNNILYKIKAVGGSITTGWSDIEFFFRNSTAAPDADADFDAATITVNTTDFPGVSIPYNGKNIQGSESGYNNYWFGVSFGSSPTKTYNQNQEYLVCTIALPVSPAGFDFELCHNEPTYFAHYVVLTDPGGNDLTNLTGGNKFYGPDTLICNPNCPVSTPGNNHILPLNGAQPVELVDFQARKYQPTSARLDWQTALEVNFDGFEIERQRNGLWEQIGVEKGKASSGDGASYTYFDDEPPEQTAYYRLKMVDYDGTFAYSPIRSVAFDRGGSLLVFPNPVTDVLSVTFGGSMRETAMLVELVDWSGRIVLAQSLDVRPGASEKIGLGTLHLPAGIYLFRAGSTDGFRFSQNIAVLSTL